MSPSFRGTMHPNYRSPMTFRRQLLFVTVLIALQPVAVEDVAPVNASSGSFGFCRVSTDDRCIEQVVVTRTDGTTATYTSAAALSVDGVQADIGCSAMGGSCDGAPTSAQVADAAKTCSPVPTDMMMRSMNASGGVIGHRDWTVRIDARTGTFEPAFSLGHGIIDTRIGADGDGTWSYSITLKPVVRVEVDYPPELRFVGPMPPDFTQRINNYLATAEASMAHAKAEASIWPPSYLLWNGSPSTGCGYLPLTGMWGTTNGNGFEFGLRKKENPGDGLPYEFVFKVSSAHFIRKDMLDVQVARFGSYDRGPFYGEKIVNPADIRMMLPRDYLTSLGYAQATDIPASALVVKTEDGQAATPSIVPRPDGSAVLDFGISHFSAPNPSVSLQPKNNARTSGGGLSMRRRQSTAASRFVNTATKGTRAWTATGKCRASGTRIVASSSPGTCRVTLTVRDSRRKVLFRKTVAVVVT